MLQGYGPTKISVSLKAAFLGFPIDSSNWLNILLFFFFFNVLFPVVDDAHSPVGLGEQQPVWLLLHTPKNGEQCTLMWEHLSDHCADLLNAWQQDDTTIKQGGKEVRRGMYFWSSITMLRRGKSKHGKPYVKGYIEVSWNPVSITEVVCFFCLKSISKGN